jgi:FkbM family methyltransferase
MSNVLSKLFLDAKNRWKSITNPELKKANLNWLKIRKLKFLYYNKPGVFHLKNRNFHFTNGPELLHSLKEIFVGDIYKIKFDTPAPYIIDCGANMGLSVLYYKHIAPNARIIAFEPDVNNFELLKKNVEGLPEVKILNQAIWKENTTLKFAASGTLSSKIVTDTTAQTINVQAVRLRDYLVEPVDFLKLDIEGAEYEVLKDCGESIKLAKNIFIEYHGHFNTLNQLNEILDLLVRNQFAYYIKEADFVYPTPFFREQTNKMYDVQLNIFCFKN